MGFLDAFSMCISGWLICLGVVFGMVCDAFDCGWLKLGLLADALRVLVLGDGGVARVVFGRDLGVCWE